MHASTSVANSESRPLPVLSRKIRDADELEEVIHGWDLDFRHLGPPACGSRLFQAMSLVSTTILTFDNQTLVVPNSKIWGDVIRNVTAQDIRRVDLEFGLSHAVDVARAEEVLASILREHPKVLEDPEPLVKVHKLTDSATQFVVRPWVKREDYWQVYWDLTREAKLRLDREKIPLGIRRHEVRLHGESTD